MGESVEDQVRDWLVEGGVGTSSACMAMWLAFGRRTRASWWGAYPHDPADLDRCLQLLHRAPSLRERLPKMREINREWAALIDRWGEIEASHLDEVGLGWTKARRAPKTYALIREVLAAAEEAPDG